MITHKSLLIGIAISFVLLITAGVVEEVAADASGAIRVDVYETCWMGSQNCGSRSFTEWEYVYPDPHTRTVVDPWTNEVKEIHDHGWQGVVSHRREQRPRYAIWSCSEC